MCFWRIRSSLSQTPDKIYIYILSILFGKQCSMGTFFMCKTLCWLSLDHLNAAASNWTYLSRVERYYMIHWLEPLGRLSGGCLLDTATILAIIITAERLNAQTVKGSESIALWDCNEHRAVYTLTSGNTFWTILRELAS